MSFAYRRVNGFDLPVALTLSSIELTEQKITDICEALPQAALDFMNTVHCEEVLLTQKLQQALESKQEHDKVDALLRKRVQHTVRHFAREERLMEECRFPPISMHQGEHVLVLEALDTAESNWLATRDASALDDYLSQGWRNRLIQHISTMDTVTARFQVRFDIQVDLDLD